MFSSIKLITRYILLIYLLGIFINASEINIAAKIIDKTVASLFPKNEKVKTWANQKYHIDIISHSRKMSFSTYIKDASFYLVGSTIPNYFPKDAVIFTTDLNLFYKNERIIGTFYWQKGRPNLMFLQSRLDKYNLSLSDEFIDYIEDE